MTNKTLKLNEDVNIENAALATQYTNAQKQMLDLDGKINQLQTQINKYAEQKVKFERAMVAIEQKAAASQKNPVKSEVVAKPQPKVPAPAGQPQVQPQTAQTTQNMSYRKDPLGNILILEEDEAEGDVSGEMKLNDKYDTALVSQDDMADLIFYLDAEDISYNYDSENDVIEFDKTELDKEWQENLDYIGLSPLGEPPLMRDEDSAVDYSDNIEEDKVFFVKVRDEEDGEFIGKLYKLEDNGDWMGKVSVGKSDTFEKLNYDPEFDEIDIIAFLRDNYEDADIIDELEYNQYVEEHDEDETLEPELEEGLTGNGNMLLRKQPKKVKELDEDEESIEAHKIPTFDQFKMTLRKG